jgi:hypothetical protein
MSSPSATPPTPAGVHFARSAGPAGRLSPTRSALVWTALAIVYVVWGSTYLGIRVAVETLPPLGSAAARFAAAAVVLAVILRVRRGAGAMRVDRRQLGSAARVGVLLLAGGNGRGVLAESGPAGVAVPSGIAALLVATVPLLVVLLRSATGDRPRLASIGGVAVGFVGLVLLVLPRGAPEQSPGRALTVVRRPPPGRSVRSSRRLRMPTTRSSPPSTRCWLGRRCSPSSPPAGASCAASIRRGLRPVLRHSALMSPARWSRYAYVWLLPRADLAGGHMRLCQRQWRWRSALLLAEPVTHRCCSAGR